MQCGGEWPSLWLASTDHMTGPRAYHDVTVQKDRIQKGLGSLWPQVIPPHAKQSTQQNRKQMWQRGQ